MPRMYTIIIDNGAVAAASGDYDLLELDAAADKPLELVGIRIGQSTEFGDAQEEQLRINVVRGNTTTGNGTATTPRPVSPVDTAAGFVAETLATTPASAGTAVTLLADDYNVRQGYEWGPVPQGFGFWTSGAELLCVRLAAAVADDLSLSATFWVVEYP